MQSHRRTFEASAIEILRVSDYRPATFKSTARKMVITPEYLSIGGNRNPAAADWDVNGPQLLAFGADNSIALWDPSVLQQSLQSWHY